MWNNISQTFKRTTQQGKFVQDTRAISKATPNRLRTVSWHSFPFVHTVFLQPSFSQQVCAPSFRNPNFSSGNLCTTIREIVDRDSKFKISTRKSITMIPESDTWANINIVIVHVVSCKWKIDSGFIWNYGNQHKIINDGVFLCFKKRTRKMFRECFLLCEINNEKRNNVRTRFN